MRLFKYIILINIFLITQLFSQGKITVADSVSRSPVENVVVANSAGKTIITDKHGNFNLGVFSPADTLVFSHLAYVKKKILVKEIKSDGKIFLRNKIFVEEEIEVLGQSSGQDKVEFKQAIIIENDLKQSFANVGDLLKAASILQVKDYGGYSGMKTVSSRGMSSENTIVLFNEARLNDLRSGIFDFSKLSSFSIDKIEIYRNADQDNAYSAAGGVVKIYSDNDEDENLAALSVKFGSGNLQSLAGKLAGAGGEISYTINFERATAQNDYRFSFLGEEYKRKNSQYSKSFISGNFSYKSSSAVIKFYSHYSHFKNGIPGYVVSNNIGTSIADNTTDSFLGILNARVNFDNNLSLHSTLSFHNQLNIFSDPAQVLFMNQERKDSRLNDVTATTRLRFSGKELNLVLGHEYNYADISGMNFLEQHDELSTSYRYANKFFISSNYSLNQPLEFMNSIILNASANYHIIKQVFADEKKSQAFSYSFGIAGNPTISDNLFIKAHYFNNRRIPTLNEQFYSNVFFPEELEDEKYKGFDVGFDYKFQLLGRSVFSFAFFSIDGTDKIIWLPTRHGLQKPTNFGKVKTTGVEIILTQSLFEGLVDLKSSYVLTDARNKNNLGAGDKSHDKLLLYSPLHRLKINGTLKLEKFSFAVYTHYESERFYSADNSARHRLEPFFITDLSLSYFFEMFSSKSSLTVNAYNIFNQEYLIIQSYPMPLTNYSITYNLEIL